MENHASQPATDEAANMANQASILELASNDDKNLNNKVWPNKAPALVSIEKKISGWSFGKMVKKLISTKPKEKEKQEKK